MPPETFFQYLDGSGAMHLVDGLEKVPEAYRAGAKKIELPAAEAETLKEALSTIERVGKSFGPRAESLGGQVLALSEEGAVEPVSFGLGVGAGLGVAVLLWIVKGTAKLALKLAILALLIALGVGLYFGLTGPGGVQKAADQLDAARKATEKEL